MSIQLVQEYKKISPEIPMCQTHCAMFDEITGKCGFFDNEVPRDPLYTASCSHFINEDDWEDFAKEIQDESESIHSYPNEPNTSIREDAVWYISPDSSFGCWVVSMYQQNRLMIVDNSKDIKGWHDEVYKSPFPLHNHGYEPKIAINTTWFIDEDGYGQYALLDDEGDLILHHPKNTL